MFVPSTSSTWLVHNRLSERTPADMARIDPLPVNEWPKEMKTALAALAPPEPRHPKPPREGRPAALNTLGTFAHHPALARAFFTFNGHLLMATTLDERQREMIVLRVSSVRGAGYEWAQHLFVARDVGLTNDEIAHVAYGPDAPFWKRAEAALLRAVDELIGDGAIAEGTWNDLSTDLDEQQLLDLIFTVTAYDGLSRMSRSLDLELDDDIRAMIRPEAATSET